MNTILGSTRTQGTARRPLVFPALVLGLLATAGCGGGGSGSGPAAAAVSDGSDVTTVTPAVGPASGGTLVTITGMGFVDDVAGPTTVRFGGAEASAVTVVDDTMITCMTPAGTMGLAVDVMVKNSKGNGILKSGFAFLVPEEVTSDLDGDGVADMAVGAPRDGSGALNAGSVYVFLGNDLPVPMESRAAAQADRKIAGAMASANFGYSLATGDLNGDGQDDLVIGCDLDDTMGTDAGAACVFFGPIPAGPLDSSDADIIILGDGAASGDRFGSSVAMGDIDDDGRMDLMVGAVRSDVNPGQPGAKLDAGRMYIFLGASTLTNATASQADIQIAGPEAGCGLGNQVLCADTDGDGIDDLVIAASKHDPVHPPKKTNAGSVFIFRGRAGFAPAGTASADIVLMGEQVGDEFGDSLATGDVDGDGTLDLMVGAPRHDTLGSDVGRVYVFLGGAGLGTMIAWNADYRIDGQPTNDSFGDDLSAGDVNGDGMADIVIGACEASFGANHNGRTYVFMGGPALKNSVATLADVIFTGEPIDGDRFGSCSRVADLDGDYVTDILSSSPGNDAGGPGAGRVYLFEGAQFMSDRWATEDDATYTGEGAGGQFGSSVVDGQ